MTQTISLGKINAKRVREAVNTLLWKAKSFEEKNSRLNANGDREESSHVLTSPFSNPDPDVVNFLSALDEKYSELNEKNFKNYLIELNNYMNGYEIKVFDKRKTKEELQKEDTEREQAVKEQERKQAEENAAIHARGGLTEGEKISLGTKEITRRIREQLKKDFKDCTFSVSFESYAGGSSITVALMQSSFKVIQDFKELSEDTINKCCDRNRRSREQLKQTQEDGYHQLNHNCFRDDYDPDSWNNGVFLTREGYELFKKINAVINHYNYDHSDPQTDYFNVNFYYDLHIGHHEKSYKLIEQTIQEE